MKKEEEEKLKLELYQDLMDAIVPVLQKWRTPGSHADAWDLYGALDREIQKINPDYIGIRK